MSRSLEFTKHRVRLGTESLESRQLLAGAIDVILTSGNDLVVLGDNASNQISVTRFEDEIIFAALDAETRINGQFEVRYPADAVEGNVLIDLGNGDNVLRLGGEAHDDSGSEHTTVGTAEEPHDDSEERLTFFGDVEIYTGRGSDSIRVSFVDLMGDLTINTTSGDDAINVGRGPGFGGGHDDHSAPSETEVAATTADDDHHGTAGPPADVFVGGQLSIKAGNGADGVKVAFTEVVENLTIDSGPGDDYVLSGRGPVHDEHGPGGGGGGHDGGEGGHDEGGHDELLTILDEEPHAATGRPPDVHVYGDMRVSTGAGDDFALLRNAFVLHDLQFDGRSGNDALGTQNVTVTGDASFDGGAGTDVMAAIASRFHASLAMDGRSEADLVLIRTSQVDGRADVNLGSFDDVVGISTSQFNSPVTLNGGSGTDSSVWLDENNEFGSTVDERSIENETALDMDEIIAAIEEIFAGFLQGHL